jgi:hypothetical protein
MDREIRYEIRRCHMLIHYLRQDPELQRLDPGLLPAIEQILRRNISLLQVIRRCQREMKVSR